MNDTKLLIGSLSNDLYRAASLSITNEKAAKRFFVESQRWLKSLSTARVKPYIRTILNQLTATNEYKHQDAETYLLYSILLQNYTLHINE